MSLQTNTVVLKSQSLADSENGVHAFEDLVLQISKQGGPVLSEFTHIGVIESGMQSGNSAIGIFSKDENGVISFFELSLNLLNEITSFANTMDKIWKDDARKIKTNNS